MKNKELWEIYKEYTKTVTEIARKLGFGAAAICWLFKTNDNTFPPSILFSLIFIVLYFIFDIFQFLFGAIIIGIWTRSEEKKMWKKKKTIEGDYNKPAWLDYPSLTMWGIKVICLLASFFFIGFHLFQIGIK